MQQIVYSPVMMFLHRLPTTTTEFVELTLQDGRTLTMTPYHLLFVADCDSLS